MAADSAVRQVLEGYKAAVFAKDVDAFIALYDADLQVFDMWGQWSHRGLAAWRAMAAEWFGSLGTERVVVDFSEVHTVVSPDLAVAYAFVTYTAVGADGAKLRSLDNRMTLALRPQGGAWKIVHEHTSAPIDGETTKAIFQR
jgi:uncharacterized protein (TIGR02246 family)